MTNGDDKLTRVYRELPADEPPAALDAAIRDAAHRAVVPRRGAQRWAMPVSLAAVLVLAVGVTLRMQQEQPGIETSAPANEYSMPSSAPEPAPAPAPKKLAAEAPPPQDSAATTAPSQPKPAEPAVGKAVGAAEVQKLKKDQQSAGEADMRLSRRDAAANQAPPIQEEKRAFADNAERNVASPMATAPAPAAPPAAGVAASAAPARERQESAPAPALRAQIAPQSKMEAPAAPAMAQSRAKEMSADKLDDSSKGPRERELDRIAQLRREGKHAEADEALAKFRREHPDYRIPEAVWEQVKPR